MLSLLMFLFLHTTRTPPGQSDGYDLERREQEEEEENEPPAEGIFIPSDSEGRFPSTQLLVI